MTITLVFSFHIKLHSNGWLAGRPILFSICLRQSGREDFLCHFDKCNVCVASVNVVYATTFRYSYSFNIYSSNIYALMLRCLCCLCYVSATLSVLCPLASSLSMNIYTSANWKKLKRKKKKSLPIDRNSCNMEWLPEAMLIRKSKNKNETLELFFFYLFETQIAFMFRKKKGNEHFFLFLYPFLSKRECFCKVCEILVSFKYFN